jgi:hypothetical protein
MHLATVAFLFGGSLFVSASSAASDLPRLQLGNSPVPRASIPEAIASQNIRDAAPAAAQFTPQNGYTGDLTLLAGMRGQANPQTSVRVSPADIFPLANPPESLLRFDQQLPQGRVAAPLLETPGRGRALPVIYFVPSAGEK